MLVIVLIVIVSRRVVSGRLVSEITTRVAPFSIVVTLIAIRTTSTIIVSPVTGVISTSTVFSRPLIVRRSSLVAWRAFVAIALVTLRLKSLVLIAASGRITLGLG
jgi:hypothetical protein